MQAAKLLLEAMQYIQTDPARAADLLDTLALRLATWASLLRSNQANIPEGWKANGGFTDKVTISVVGPDGEVKQTATT